MTGRSLLRAIGEAGARRLVGTYFELSYRLLATPSGHALLLASAPPGAPVVHGYSTSEDLDVLVEALRPSDRDLLVDLGSGIGEVAMAVHRRTRCRVIGVDAAHRAVVEARRRAREAGAAGAVRFLVGDLASPPTGGSSAYALDSLMFVRRPLDALADAARSLEPPGRVFVTFVDHRGLDDEAFARFIEVDELRVERLHDVTAAFRDRSRRRAAVARQLLRGRPESAGRLALILVLAEEAVVLRLIDRGVLRRWRFTAIRGATASQTQAGASRPAA